MANLKTRLFILLTAMALLVGCGSKKVPPHSAYVCRVGGSYMSFAFDKDGLMSYDGVMGKWKHEKGDYYSIYTVSDKFVGYMLITEDGITAVSEVGEKAPLLNCIIV